MPEAPGQVRQPGEGLAGDVHAGAGAIRAAGGGRLPAERLLREARVQRRDGRAQEVPHTGTYMHESMYVVYSKISIFAMLLVSKKGNSIFYI